MMATQETQIVIQRDFQNSEIEIIQKDSLAWISAEDIAKGLGLASHTSLMRTYSRNKDEIEPHTDFDGRIDRNKLFNQHGVFALIDHSRGQQASDFKTWLIQEVSQLSIPQTQPVIQPQTQQVQSYRKVDPTFIPINTTLIERDEHDHILNLAVLTQEHVLFNGPPGTAKSLHADLFFKNFIAQNFSVQLSKFSTEEVLFGPLNIPKLREGVIDYLYENSILTANFAFIDEIFDASDVLLRSLLGVLNERHFAKGSFSLDVPLITTVATANYVRANEITEAVIDRFLFQFPVEPIKKKEEILNFRMPIVKPTVNLSDLKYFQDKVSRVVFPKSVQSAYIGVCESFDFTDRRIVNGIKVLKANAWLKGRTVVADDDMMVLKYLVGLDKNKIMSATQSITEMVGNISLRNKQFAQLDSIRADWSANESRTNKKSHLKAEMEILKRLKMFDPMDDHVERQRDEILIEYHEHFEERREEYIENLNLGGLLSASNR